MKTSIRKLTQGFTLRFVLAVTAIIGLLAALALSRARATDTQGYPSTFGQATNLPPILTSGSVSNFTSVIALRNYSGLGLEAILGATSNSANVGIFLSPSVDGTNFDTRPWVWVVGLNGPTNVVATTNWDVNRLRGYQALAITGMTNGGVATVTNVGISFNRPNN